MKNLYKIHWMFLFQKSSILMLFVLVLGCCIFFIDRLQVSSESMNSYQAATLYLGDTNFLLEQLGIVCSIFLSHQVFLKKQDAYVVYLLAKNNKRSNIFLSKWSILFIVIAFTLMMLFLLQRILGLIRFPYFFEIALGLDYYILFYLVTAVYALYAILLAQIWDSFFGAFLVFFSFMLSNLMDGKNIILQ